jgi:uncharacterized protein with beta-barrel porin domain
MKNKIISAAIAALFTTVTPISSSRQAVTLPYIFGAGDTAGISSGIDTTGTTPSTLTINPNININTSNDPGGAIRLGTNDVTTIYFLGNSTLTGPAGSGTGPKEFLDIRAGVNGTTVNFNGDVFSKEFHHLGTGNININGNVNSGLAASSYIFIGDGFLNIGAGKSFTSAITTLVDNTGTLTLNGGSSMTGAIGSGAFGLKLINVVGGNAAVTGAVDVQSITLGANTLTINGALTTHSGGNIATTFTSDTTFGKVIVNGASNVNAGGITVTTTVAGPLTLGASPFQILTGTSGAGTPPVTVINTSPRYTFTGLVTTFGSIDLVLTSIAPLSTLTSLITSPAALPVAFILDEVATPGSDLETVQEAIGNLPTANAINNALAQLAPANTNLAAPWVAAQATQLFLSSWTSRLDEITNKCCDTACDVGDTKSTIAKQEDCKNYGAQASWWAKGIGNFGKQDDVNSLNGYNTRAMGIMLGHDVPINKTTKVGFGAGYVKSSLNGNNSDNKTRIDSYQLAAYFTHTPEDYFLQGAIIAGIDNYDGSRKVDFTGVNRIAKSDTSGQQYTAVLTAGKHLAIEEMTVTPLVGVQASRIHVKGYEEQGAGDVNLRVGSQDYNLLQSIVGLKLERVIQSGSSTYAPEIHVKWLHDFNSTTMQQDAIFMGGGSKFTMTGIEQDRNTYNVGAGVTFLTCNCEKNSWAIKGLYDYKWNGSGYDSNQISLVANMKF